MKNLTAIEEERLYRLVYFKIKELEKQLENTDYKKLQEQLQEEIEEYTKMLNKF